MNAEKCRTWKGSFTVETACLLPMFILVLHLCIVGCFYYHDKNVISSCAYETAVVGSTKSREKDGVTPETLERAFQERLRGKCILFSGASVRVRIGENQIIVQATASRHAMKVSVVHTAAVTEPEDYIRHRRWK